MLRPTAFASFLWRNALAIVGFHPAVVVSAAAAGVVIVVAAAAAGVVVVVARFRPLYRWLCCVHRSGLSSAGVAHLSLNVVSGRWRREG